MISGRIGNYEIRILNEKKTHIKELTYFEIYLGERIIAKCHYFSGRDYYPAWLEIDYNPWIRQEDEELEVQFFKIIYDFLPHNSRLFVTYDKDKETAELIFKGYSVLDTPLGFALLRAGFTWFKVWYFPEGGNEGGPKIQANKPISEEIGKRELLELIRSEEIKNLRVKEWIVNNVKG